jgi:hypothetical protein
MDFIDELKKTKEENISLGCIIDNLHEQEAIILKKIHVFKIMKLAKNIAALANSELSRFHKIDGVTIARHDHSVYFFSLFDKNKQIFDSGEVYKQFGIIEGLMNFNQNNISKSMQKVTILFDENFEKNFIDTFLNEELRSILDYSQMQLELDNKNSFSKKIKI